MPEPIVKTKPENVKQSIWLMPPSQDRANKRSETPMGFARAVFEANRKLKEKEAWQTPNQRGEMSEEIQNGHGQHYFVATAEIGSIFGHEVHGQIRGIGPTKERALERLEEDRKRLYESLWY
jgi:hypothetical protein